jgi:hypothetical protein
MIKNTVVGPFNVVIPDGLENGAATRCFIGNPVI